MGENRKSKILNHLYDQGQTPVQELADAVGVSLATLRRDLSEMETSGAVERSHGAARIANAAQPEAAFGSRETTNLSAKRAIAKAAFQSIRPESTIFLDAGTTVLQLARLIRMDPFPVTVFTNGLVVAQELAQVSDVTLCVLGGRLRAENMSLVGPLAGKMLDGLWFDALFMGASAISQDGWVTSFDPDEADLNTRMLARTDRACLLVDHNKFQQRAAYSVFQLQHGHRVITDRAVPGVFGQFAANAGADVQLTGSGWAVCRPIVMR